jgi:hypothetical protein
MVSYSSPPPQGWGVVDSFPKIKILNIIKVQNQKFKKFQNKNKKCILKSNLHSPNSEKVVKNPKHLI